MSSDINKSLVTYFVNYIVFPVESMSAIIYLYSSRYVIMERRLPQKPVEAACPSLWSSKILDVLLCTER